MLFDVSGLFSLLRACSVSVAASGVKFGVGRSVISSKGVQRVPGRPKLISIFFQFYFPKKANIPACYLLWIQLIDGNFIFSHSLAKLSNTVQGKKGC